MWLAVHGGADGVRCAWLIHGGDRLEPGHLHSRHAWSGGTCHCFVEAEGISSLLKEKRSSLACYILLNAICRAGTEPQGVCY